MSKKAKAPVIKDDMEQMIKAARSYAPETDMLVLCGHIVELADDLIEKTNEAERSNKRIKLLERRLARITGVATGREDK